MRVEIHKNSGFCFGVTQAISKIEELLQSNNELLCLGEIVHNSEEVNRLSQLGMHTITTNDIESTKNPFLPSHLRCGDKSCRKQYSAPLSPTSAGTPLYCR